MEIQPGLAYTVSNDYFRRHADPFLVMNHGSDKWGDGARPYFVAFQDKREPDIYWAVPLSSNAAKYGGVYTSAIEQRGYCDTLHFADFANRSDVWLIQNMCPITERYVTGLCMTRSGNPIVPYHKDAKEATRKASKVLKLVQHGVKGLVYPDIERLYKGLLLEKAIERSAERSGASSSAQMAFANAVRRARDRNASLPKHDGPPGRDR